MFDLRGPSLGEELTVNFTFLNTIISTVSFIILKTAEVSNPPRRLRKKVALLMCIFKLAGEDNPVANSDLYSDLSDADTGKHS